MDWELLINPLVGGVIGYATNYLAIKMLFRPHNAKYIGNFKIPFTPGLIPKEKATLARQMGEITEEYLLTEDMLVETLTGPKAKEMFSKFSDGIPKQMEDSDKTVGEFAKHLLGEGVETSIEAIVNQLTLEIVTMLSSLEVKNLVVPYTSKVILEIVKNNLLSDSDNKLIGNIEELGKSIIESEDTRQPIYDLIDELEVKLEELLKDNAVAIGNGVIKAISEGEQADRIKETMQHWVDENFNPMVSMFINIDKIYAGIIEFSDTALKDQDRSSKFAELLPTVMKGIKDSNPDYKDIIIDIAKTELNEKNIKLVMGLLAQELNEKEKVTKSYIEEFIGAQWEDQINSDPLLEIIKKVIVKLMQPIQNIRLANLSMLISTDTKEQINETVFLYYKKIISTNSNEVANVMDISRMVEEKINEYSSEEAEKVILSVVKTQLRGITWIGAILGALIGIFSNFLG